ncbi:hypothetical protein NA57DRAFT_72240 [Rhizodiscina lignyota]|uniref:Heterokaryon incompatibility domain-containing protein n=1 Tax=Rhizodiscina lignyota TaxID=1504668 RepID=A0A9P4IKK4_9PEZI|nr:hypothetical protein NA57DRAFT_72240 [Rhizodiscina lignyota]
MAEVEHHYFQYNPIESAEIRLVQFHETENGISGRFETFLLDDESRPVPAYRALSYVWSLHGNIPTISWSITVDNKILLVLDSLCPFFEVLKAKMHILDCTWWWIDSLSVNQKDFPEKGNQVRLMSRIYKQAEETVVWLGERSDDSEDAMEFINLLHRMGPIQLPYPEIPEELKQPCFDSKWTALKKILERKWWTRIWTIQEYALSKRVSLWCGDRIVSREAFSHSLELLNRPHNKDVPDGPAFANGWNRRRVQMWHTLKSQPEFRNLAGMSLAALAAYCGNCDATDDRDRLYALRAIATDYELLEVDYTLSTEDVYLRFTQSFISHHRSLDIICLAHTYWQFEGSSLPSWVPDWRRKTYSLVIPQMISQTSRGEIGNLRPTSIVKPSQITMEYSASGHIPAVFTFVGTTLIVQGIILDVVDGLGTSESSELVQSSAPIISSQEASHNVEYSALDSLKSICNCIVLSRKDRYLQEPVPMKDFIWSFWVLCSDVRNNCAADIHPTFVNWFNGSRHLLVRGATLDSIVAQSALSDDSSLSQGPESLDGRSIQIQDSFLGRFYDTVIRMSRRLLVGETGILGMAPGRAKKGDYICILKGCSVPVILRRTADVGLYSFVGECFVDGYMSGEAFHNPKLREKSISIC